MLLFIIIIGKLRAFCRKRTYFIWKIYPALDLRALSVIGIATDVFHLLGLSDYGSP